MRRSSCVLVLDFIDTLMRTGNGSHIRDSAISRERLDLHSHR